MPFLAVGPGVRPGTSHAPVTLVDLLPTLADLAGAAAPGGRALDGGSIAPLLRGNHTATIARRAPYLLWHQAVDRQPQTAILMDGLKLVKLWPSGLQLFNLGENRVAEGRNLVAHGLASRLHARLRAHLNAAGAETRKTVEKRSTLLTRRAAAIDARRRQIRRAFSKRTASNCQGRPHCGRRLGETAQTPKRVTCTGWDGRRRAALRHCAPGARCPPLYPASVLCQHSLILFYTQEIIELSYDPPPVDLRLPPLLGRQPAAAADDPAT